MTTFTAQNVIDQARPFVDRDGTDDAITNTQLVTWLSPRYFSMRRRIAEIAPDLYTATAQYTVAVGVSTFAIVQADFGKLLKLEKLQNGQYYPLNVAPLLTDQSVINGYRVRGLNVDLYPATGMDGTYVLTYVQKPTTALALVTDTLDLPDGCDHVLAMELAALLAYRMDQDPAALWALAGKEWERVAEDIANQYGGTPQGIARIWD